MAQVEQPTLRREPNAAPYVVLRQQLVAARKRAQLTQAELAARLGRPQSFVAKYEVGERFVDAVELIVIAHEIDLDLGEVATAVKMTLE